MLKVTRKELDVLELLARGYPAKKVAHMLNVTSATVYHRLKQMYHRNEIAASVPMTVLASWYVSDGEQVELV